MTTLERFFSKNAKRMQSELSEEQFKVYHEIASMMLKRIVWIALAVIVTLVFNVIETSNSEVVSKLYVIAVVIIFQIIALLIDLKKIYPIIYNVTDVKERWKNGVFAVAFAGVIAFGVAVMDFVDILSRMSNNTETTFNAEQIFTCEEVGMKVTVPSGYTEITYEDVGTENSVRWYVENNETVIWVYTYMGWSYVDSYQDAEGNKRHILDAHFDAFEVLDKIYYRGGFLADPLMTEVHLQPAYMSYGKRDVDSDYKFIIYRFLRNDALICVTYAFSSTLDEEDQKQKAYEFVSKMEFE